MKISMDERFWRKVAEGDDGCWEFTGAHDSQGYAMFFVGPKIGNRGAHRVAYTLLMDEIPDGLDLDHLCRNRGCVNPYHLEPVSHRVNVLRGDGVAARHARMTHCKRGHDLAEHAYIMPNGGRDCRACRRARYALRRG